MFPRRFSSNLEYYYYDKGHGDYGHKNHDVKYDNSYHKGYSKGFDKAGYGDYGRQKHGGWEDYAKGEEHASHYGRAAILKIFHLPVELP